MRYPALLAAAIYLALTALPAGAAEDANGGDKTKSTAHKITQANSYVEFDPIYATFMENDRPAGLLMVWIGVDIADGKLRAEAQHAAPVIRDAYVRNMMGYASTIVRSWRQPDVGEIADRLQAVTDRALSRKGARVLLYQVALRIQPVQLDIKR